MSSFGKPRQSTDTVRCLSCGEEYPERAVELKHAGRTVEGDFWNCKCPECGSMNGMRAEYAELSESEFRAKQHEVARSRQEARREQRWMEAQ